MKVNRKKAPSFTHGCFHTTPESASPRHASVRVNNSCSYAKLHFSPPNWPDQHSVDAAGREILLLLRGLLNAFQPGFLRLGTRQRRQSVRDCKLLILHNLNLKTFSLGLRIWGDAGAHFSLAICPRLAAGFCCTVAAPWFAIERCNRKHLSVSPI